MCIIVLPLLSSCGGQDFEGMRMPEAVEMIEVAATDQVQLRCVLNTVGNVAECGFGIARSGEAPERHPGVLAQDGSFYCTVTGLRQDTEYSWFAFWSNGKDEAMTDTRTFRTEKLPYDPVLWEAILKEFDKDGDGKLSDSEKRSATEFTISDLRLSSLSGLEELEYLERLNCGGNGLKELDVSALKNLTFLGCGRDNYERMIFDNPKLAYIYIVSTPLKDLDTSKLPELNQLDSYDNPFESLSFESNPILSHITLEGAAMEELDLSTNVRMEVIFVRNNPDLRVLWLHPDCKPRLIDINDNTQIKYK